MTSIESSRISRAPSLVSSLLFRQRFRGCWLFMILERIQTLCPAQKTLVHLHLEECQQGLTSLEEITGIPSHWGGNYQTSTATEGTAKCNSQPLCESEVPLKAVQSLPQRETGEEKVSCRRKDRGESQSSSTNAAFHGVSHSNLDESSYLGSFEEIEHMLLTGGSSLGSDCGRAKSVSGLLDHDSLLGQSALRVLRGFGNIRRITETALVMDDDAAGNPSSRMGSSPLSGKGSLSCQVPQLTAFPAKEQVIHNVNAASSTKVTSCTGNPVMLGHLGESSAFGKVGKKETSMFASRTPPELHYSVRKKPLPLGIISNADKLDCPAIVMNSVISPKKRAESQSNSRSSVLYGHLSAEPEKAATRGEQERYDIVQQLSMAGRGGNQNFPMSMQEEGVFQQADAGVSRSQFTLHGWAAAFLRPLKNSPEGEWNERCMGASQQQSEVEASIDMVHPILKDTGSPCKPDPSTHKHGDSRTSSSSSSSSSQWNSDMNFPGKRSKGGCAWTVDDLTQTELVE